ncbi:MAG: isochorismatase family protein [Alphaproteobacteria bacterium]|nr:isochorismatase family protein [Alphaproteobacteria bacterium]
MTRPVLICQGFQRAFIDIDSPMFSVSASMRRSACEQVLKRARSAGWTLLHSYLDSETLGAAGGASIEGFSPSPAESYFRQRSLSAFSTRSFDIKLDALADAPIFLISLAGLSVIGATFFDALERRLDIHIVTDAVADVSRSGVDEEARLAAIETMARAHDRHVTCRDLVAMATLAVRPRPEQLPAYGVL